MSQWAHENPDLMAEIAALPMRRQNAALRHAVGYDPDRIRDQLKEDRALMPPAEENPHGDGEDGSDDG